jgi:hypothetical protein
VARYTPTQRARLAEIARNLADRIAEAKANGWLGEVQGLQISLEHARQKLASLDRLAGITRRVPVPIEMPIIGADPGPRRGG